MATQYMATFENQRGRRVWLANFYKLRMVHGKENWSHCWCHRIIVCACMLKQTTTLGFKQNKGEQTAVLLDFGEL